MTQLEPYSAAADGGGEPVAAVQPVTAGLRPPTAASGISTSSLSESVKVIVRCRPLSSKEAEQGHTSIIGVDVERGVIEISNPKEPLQPAKCFTFDAVYDGSSKQLDIYDESVRELVDSVLCGFNGTIFAYGQTGTGKTFTMEGVAANPDLRGVIPNAIEHIFQRIAQSAANEQYLVRASYLEIYQEEIRDLLDSKDSRRRLELKERPDIGVFVKDLSSFVTKSADEIEQVLAVGRANRSVGCTNMNEHSSRSHAIFILTVECSELGIDGESHIRVGRLNLVDLAGSERQTKTGAQGQRFREATKINLSLSALGNVISALVDNKAGHIPYRDSKLTRLLQDSLGGNSKTVMVANIGPASYNYEETMSTLRYASRAKNIQNRPKINEDPKDALLREFQDEINRLKSLLEKRTSSAGGHRRRQSRQQRDSAAADDSRDEGVADLSAEEFVQEQQQKLEMEREQLLRSSTILDEEKQRMLDALETRGAELAREREMQLVVAAKIRAMQSKLLSGDGSNLLNRTRQQQELLQRRRLELAEQKRREREIAQRLEAQEDSTAEIRETFASLRQEVEAKTRKLHKFLGKLEQVRLEIRDNAEANARERQQLASELTEIDRILKLKCLLIENFVPASFVENFKARAVFDAEEDIWHFEPSPRRDAPSRATFTASPAKPEMVDSGLESSGSARIHLAGSGPDLRPAGPAMYNASDLDAIQGSEHGDSSGPRSMPIRPTTAAGSLRRLLCRFERNLLARLRQRMQRLAHHACSSQLEGPGANSLTSSTSASSELGDSSVLSSLGVHGSPAANHLARSFVPYEVARVCCENLLTFDGLIRCPATVIDGLPPYDDLKRSTAVSRPPSRTLSSLTGGDASSRIPVPRASLHNDVNASAARSRRTSSAAPFSGSSPPATPAGPAEEPDTLPSRHFSASFSVSNSNNSMLNASKNLRARSVLVGETSPRQQQIREQQQNANRLAPRRTFSSDVLLGPGSAISQRRRNNNNNVDKNNLNNTNNFARSLRPYTSSTATTVVGAVKFPRPRGLLGAAARSGSATATGARRPPSLPASAAAFGVGAAGRPPPPRAN